MMKHRFVAFVIFALVSSPSFGNPDTDWDQAPTGHYALDDPTGTLSAWQQLTPDLAIRVYSREEDRDRGMFMNWVFKNTGTCQLQPFTFSESYINYNTGKRLTFDQVATISLHPGQVSAKRFSDCNTEEDQQCWYESYVKKGTFSIKITSPSPLQCVPQAAPAPAGSILISP